jgi:hypothetical protein
MQVHIRDMRSTVHATDPNALMSGPMLDRLVRAVAQEVMRVQGREERLCGDRRLEPRLAIDEDERRLV